MATWSPEEIERFERLEREVGYLSKAVDRSSKGSNGGRWLPVLITGLAMVVGPAMAAWIAKGGGP